MSHGAVARALVLEAPHHLVVREFAVPTVGDDDALVRVVACGLCGTDHEQHTGELAGGFAFVPGQETVGTIEAIGPRAARRWGVAQGDRVAVEVFQSCRECKSCLAGEYRRCVRHGLADMYGFIPLDREPGLRAGSNEDARRRLDKTFDSGDSELLRYFRELADDHLEVIAGDKGEANLGLDQRTWQRLADTVDLIVDPAALVNGVLPYSELFGPNVVGTAELIRMALTTKLKPYIYVSTVNVGDQIEPPAFTEDADIRVISPTRAIDGSFGNGYGNSKWAGEVLLREANDLCGLPVSVFRSGRILADTTYVGQLNVPDLFTRMVLSVVAAGIAPGSAYRLDTDGNRQRAHYDGLPVGFVAEAIATLGAQVVDGFQTYHVMNPHDDGIGLDEYVDWLIEAGYPIQRIGDFGEWVQRFETTLRALPDRQRHHSVHELLLLQLQSSKGLEPFEPSRGSFAPTDRFRAAVQEAKIGPDNDIPHASAPIIIKYVTDLQRLGLLQP